MNRTLIVVGAITLLLSPSMAHASEPAARTMAGPLEAATTQKARALAEALVEAGDEREHAMKALEPIENLLSGMITAKLAIKDASAAAQIKAIVHETIAPIGSKAIVAMIKAYAANFSPQELGNVLAFMRSPAGQSEKANLPLLKSELSAALGFPLGTSTAPGIGDAGDAARVFAEASPGRRRTILRILKAQDFEAHTRKGYEALAAVLESAARGAEASRLHPPKLDIESASTKEAAVRAEDEYVRLVTAVEKRYYVSHFSEAQLAAIADYLESEAGRAILARMPVIKRVTGQVFLEQLAIAVPSLGGAVCGAIACSPEQRASVADFTRAMTAQLSSLKGFPG